MVGQLVRHGAGILHGSAPADSPTPDIKQLLAILVSFYNLPKGSLKGRDSLKVKEKALEGLGFLFVAQPAALLEPAANAAMQQALQPCAPMPLKLKVLSNLLELLKVHSGYLYLSRFKPHLSQVFFLPKNVYDVYTCIQLACF